MSEGYEDFWSEWNELYPPIDVAVCITHRRFIPCRKNDGCVISVDPAHIEMVQKYQWGDTPNLHSMQIITGSGILYACHL